MSFAYDSTHRLGIRCDRSADDKERRVDVFALQYVEYTFSIWWIRSIVKSQRYFGYRRGPMDNRLSEQLVCRVLDKFKREI